MVSDKVRALRAQLQHARNDVARYASRVHQLELQLAAQQTKIDAFAAAAAASTGRTQANGQGVTDCVDNAALASNAWVQALQAELRRDSQCTCAPWHRQRAAVDAEHAPIAATSASLLNGLERFLKQQTQTITAIGRENAKLRDQLQTRPTQRQLMTVELEVESLRQQLEKRKAKRQAQQPNATAARDDAHAAEQRAAKTDVQVLEPLASETLTERIRVDKLLRWLRVETMTVRAPRNDDPQSAPTKSQRAMHRAYLDDPTVRCYLVLDQAALAAQDRASADAKRALERRVGVLCSEIVATCCHALDVPDVSALPSAVQAARRRASLIPLFQRFLCKLQATLSSLQGDSTKHSAFELPSAPSPERTAHRDLEQLLNAIEDVAVELAARRKHMMQSPRASTAFDALFALMTLLQAKRADELEPTVVRLLEASRREQRFVLELRDLVGLERSATRDDIKRTVTALVKHLGLTHPQCTTPASRAG